MRFETKSNYLIIFESLSHQIVALIIFENQSKPLSHQNHSLSIQFNLSRIKAHNHMQISSIERQKNLTIDQENHKLWFGVYLGHYLKFEELENLSHIFFPLVHVDGVQL